MRSSLHQRRSPKYAVNIGVNPWLSDTPCRKLLNMAMDGGYLSHTMSHYIQIVCLVQPNVYPIFKQQIIVPPFSTLSKAKKKENCRGEYRPLEKHHVGGGVLLVSGLYEAYGKTIWFAPEGQKGVQTSSFDMLKYLRRASGLVFLRNPTLWFMYVPYITYPRTMNYGYAQTPWFARTAPLRMPCCWTW